MLTILNNSKSQYYSDLGMGYLVTRILGVGNVHLPRKNLKMFIFLLCIVCQMISGFCLYKEGVFTSDHCGNTPMDVNQVVLAVRYGVENDVAYWLIKNSWGATRGDNGYFKMEMGKNMCVELTS